MRSYVYNTLLQNCEKCIASYTSDANYELLWCSENEIIVDENCVCNLFVEVSDE